MGNEYPLKVMVDGLQNLATDNQTLCEFLNLRAKNYGFDERFKGADHEPPIPPYPDKKMSQAKAADLVGKIALNNSYAVLSVGGKPSMPPALDGNKHDEADLLRLMIDWGMLQSGVYKTMLRLYGLFPSPTSEPISPGPASENRLWSEIVAWLEKITADTNSYNIVQHIIPKRPPKAKSVEGTSLVQMEQGVHRVTLDLLHIAGLLPYHLYHVGRA